MIGIKLFASKAVKIRQSAAAYFKKFYSLLLSFCGNFVLSLQRISARWWNVFYRCEPVPIHVLFFFKLLLKIHQPIDRNPDHRKRTLPTHHKATETHDRTHTNYFSLMPIKCSEIQHSFSKIRGERSWNCTQTSCFSMTTLIISSMIEVFLLATAANNKDTLLLAAFSLNPTQPLNQQYS